MSDQREVCVYPEGVSAQAAVCPGVSACRGVSARQGSAPMYAGIHLPSCEQND